MIHVIENFSLCSAFEAVNRPLFRRSFSGLIEEVTGGRKIKRTGGFWNRHTYAFYSNELGENSLLEPVLRWKFGAWGLANEQIESDGFSGSIKWEKTADQIFHRLGDFEWRYDQSQQELYFDAPPAGVGLRVTLLAFVFCRRCMPD